MEITKIDINELYHLGGIASLDVFKNIDYLDSGKLTKMPAILICPGGGYGMVSKRESMPVAIEFLSNEFIPFILTYSVGEQFSYPQQLNEVAASIDYIRKNADEYGVDENRIFLIGFSAGGHLVANIGVEYLNYKEYDAKPNGVCLSYPVISREYGISGGTYDYLLRGLPEEEKEFLCKKLSFNSSDLSNFPPCFIWTTADDDCVLALNSISFVYKLVETGIKCEFHMFPTGRHGLSLGTESINNNEPYLPKIRSWVNMCVDFLKSL